MKLRAYFTEFLAGLTTSMAMVPESMAFAILAMVNPMFGLYTSFVVGLIAAIIGRPVLVSGGAGAIAIVSVGLVVLHGPEYLFAAVILMGLIQLLAGVIKAGKLISFVKEPVMIGFLNGLAIIIFTAQFVHFKGTNIYVMGAITAATITIMLISKRFIKSIPSPLIAIGIVVIVLQVFSIQTKTIGDIAQIHGGFPKFHIPLIPFNLKTLFIVLPYSLIMASVGLLESLLTKKVVDDACKQEGDSNLECIAQGAANTVSGFFSGIGGCGMIGQTIVNIESNGKTRWSGIFMAVSILMFILFGSSIIEKIPIASLAAVMFLVAIKAFQWKLIKDIKKISGYNIFISMVVMMTTLITHNLALAVLIGVGLTLLGDYVTKKIEKGS